MIKSITKKGKDKKEERVSVEEIENGFLITKSIQHENKKGEWKFDTKKWYSKTNPLEFAKDTPLADAFD